MNQLYIVGYSNYSIPYLQIENYQFDTKVLKLFKKQLVEKYCIIPIDVFDNILTVAMANPILKTINILEKITKKQIRVFKASKSQIINQINKLY